MFPDNALKAEIIAEVVESIAERVVPYSCREPETDGVTELDTRCSLSFSADEPINFDIVAPFAVSIDLTRSDLFGRTVPDVTGAELIATEIKVNSLGLENLQQVGDAIQKSDDVIDQAGDGIKKLLDR